MFITSLALSGCSFNPVTGTVSTMSAKKNEENLKTKLKHSKNMLRTARAGGWSQATISKYESEIKDIKKKLRLQFFTVDSDGKY